MTHNISTAVYPCYAHVGTVALLPLPTNDVMDSNPTNTEIDCTYLAREPPRTNEILRGASPVSQLLAAFGAAEWLGGLVVSLGLIN